MRVVKEVRLFGGKMKRKMGSETRAWLGMSLETPGRAMYHLVGYGRDLGFCSQLREEALKDLEHGSGWMYVFKGSFVICYDSDGH